MQSKDEVVIGKRDEVIQVLADRRDNIGCGIALATIYRSEPHVHRRTRETYVLLAGVLEVVFQGDNGQTRHKMTKPGDTLEIPLNQVHYAVTLDEGPATVLVTTVPPWSPEDHILIKGKR